MGRLVATAAVVAVALLSLAALWRMVRSMLALQSDLEGREPEADRKRQELLDERARQRRSLREIEFDHQTGKLSKADYDSLRRRHELAAATAIRALDKLDAGEAAP